MARHGGGAFSGKDPSKVDRSAAYAGRYVAKNIVAAGLADKCEIQVSYAIGVAEPTSISINTFNTAKVSEELIIALVREHFDLRPYGIILVCLTSFNRCISKLLLMVTSVVKVQILHLLGKKPTKWKRLKLQLVYSLILKETRLMRVFFI